MTEPIITKQELKASKEKVWNAITKKGEMIQWFFQNIPDFKSEVGFKTQFNVNTGERNFNHLWEIIDVVSEKKIVYSWKYEGYEGAGTVTFELSENEGITILTVIAENMESFPQNIPEFKRESCIGGWKYFINDRLKSYIDLKY